MRKTWQQALRLCMYAVLVLPSVAAAAERGIEEGLTLETSARHMPQSDARGQSGSVTVTEAQAGMRLNTLAGGALPVSFSLSNSYAGIENSSPLELPARLVALRADIETTMPLLSLDDTYLRFGIGPSFFGDNWSFATSDFRISLRAVLIHTASAQWITIAGVAFHPDFETEVFPVLGFIYKPTEKISLNLTPRAPAVSYAASERVTVSLEGGSSASEYEVRKGELKSAVLQYKNLRAGVGVSYRVSQTMTAACACGGVFNRTFQYRDSLGKVSLKDGAYLEVRLSASF